MCISRTIRIRIMLLLKLILCSFLLDQSWSQEKVTLQIPQGTLEGLKGKTAWHGVPMYSFKGIPYAKPNTGPDKFRISEPADRWAGVHDATKFGNNCVHFCFVKQDIVGDEDCLFLNVYTPDPIEDEKKPVIVYLHGGGFNTGNGDDTLFGADFLIENNVVVVTINYRLGAVGFLNTGDTNAPGNGGLKDQVLAFKWIKDNIIHFGGNPDKITISGQSAGGSSVQYHLLSPMSQGLFKSAIMQSGSVASPFAISLTPKEDAMALGEMLGATAKNTTELFEKLKNTPIKDIVEASMKLSLKRNRFAGEFHVFVPSVEADVGQEIFLSNDPWELLKYGEINDVPTMIGVTSEESMIHTNNLLSRASELEADFSLFIPKDLNISDPSMRKEIGETFKKFYFNGKSVNPETRTELNNALSDVQFNHGSLLTARIMSVRMTSPVYEYLFSYKSSCGFTTLLFKLQNPGALHGDELAFEFYSNMFKNIPESGSSIEKKTKEMLELWTNFVKEGDPSFFMSAVNVKWEPLGSEGNYLDIDENLSMKKSILKERMDFWVELYKNVLGDFKSQFE